MSPAPCWLAKVRMIPPCVPQVVRLDSKDFHLLNWSHSTVPMSLNSLCTTGRLWTCVHHDPVTYSLLPPECCAGLQLWAPHTAGKYTNHYWQQFTLYKTWPQGQWRSSAGPACTKFWVCSPTPNKGEGRIRSQGCRPCEPSLSCLRACLCTFTRVFS